LIKRHSRFLLTLLRATLSISFNFLRVVAKYPGQQFLNWWGACQNPVRANLFPPCQILLGRAVVTEGPCHLSWAKKYFPTGNFHLEESQSFTQPYKIHLVPLTHPVIPGL
jgi:hypothetical protein